MCGYAVNRGMDRLLVTCREDNTASARVIEACGGELESLRDVDDLARRSGYLTPMRRYWIELT